MGWMGSLGWSAQRSWEQNLPGALSGWTYLSPRSPHGEPGRAPVCCQSVLLAGSPGLALHPSNLPVR